MPVVVVVVVVFHNVLSPTCHDVHPIAGVVALLQKVLQVYAAQQLSSVNDNSDKPSQATQLLDKVLAADEGEWETLLRSALDAGETSQEEFTHALQRRMEHTVLGMSSGSYKQRVLAEYLKELQSRADALFVGVSA